MIINRVHHIAIICSDYARSKHFYTVVLGFKPLMETYRAERESYKLDLEINGAYQIELFSFPGPPPARPSRPEACGLRHLALEVDDVDGAFREISSQGVVPQPVRVDEITQKRFFFISDPDGLPLEFYEK